MTNCLIMISMRKLENSCPKSTQPSWVSGRKPRSQARARAPISKQRPIDTIATTPKTPLNSPNDDRPNDGKQVVLDALDTAVQSAGSAGVEAAPILGSPEWLDTAHMRRFQWTGFVVELPSGRPSKWRTKGRSVREDRDTSRISFRHVMLCDNAATRPGHC
jgi:hypothetical protein